MKKMALKSNKKSTFSSSAHHDSNIFGPYKEAGIEPGLNALLQQKSYQTTIPGK